MKPITKIQPLKFQQFIDKNKPRTWFELSKEIGKDLRMYMLNSEQNEQCAYTELHIDCKSSESHIDHFQKQSIFPELKFDWNNLFTACNNEYYGAKFKDKRIKETDYEYLINPAKTNPANHLSYLTTGEVLCKDKFGESTIILFNLNDKSLVEQRRAVAKQLKTIYKDFDVEVLVNQFGKFESFIREIYKKFNDEELI